MHHNEITAEKLAADLKLVISDAEELLRATASHAGEKVGAARAKVEDSLAAAKDKLDAFGEDAADQARAAVHATDDYVHEHPWQAVGVAALAGIALGLLISRR